MKRFIVLLIVLISLDLTAQEKIGGKNNTIDLSSKSSIKYWLNMYDIADKDQAIHVVKCLENYRRERGNAMLFGITGIALVYASPKINEKDTRDLMNYAGGATALISAILFIDAEKWLSGKRLLVNSNGVAFRF